MLVIGGTLFIGQALVKQLVHAGHDVTVLHRKPRHKLGKKVGNIVADRNDPDAVKRALAGKNFDVVYDNVYDWEHGTTAAQVEATARACGNNLHRYVFMSSVGAYGDGLNHHEGDALAPDDHYDPYVRNKAMSERALFRMRQRNGFPVVTLRPPFVYGPGNPFYREAFFWDRLRDGRPLILPGDGRRLMQFVHIDDLVGACVKVMDIPDIEGHAFNIANPRPLDAGGSGGGVRARRRKGTNLRASAARADLARRRPSHGTEDVLRRLFRSAGDHGGREQSAAHFEIQAGGIQCRIEGNLPLVHAAQVPEARLFF